MADLKNNSGGKFRAVKEFKKESIRMGFFFLLWATPTSYGSLQAQSQIRATAAGLCHSHVNSISDSCLQPMQQLMTMPDP